MPIANMPSGFEKAQRIFGTHFKQGLRGGLDENQISIFKFHGVAIVQHGRFIEIEQKFEPFFTAQGDATAMSAFMIKANGIDDFISLNGCFANECRGGEHSWVRFQVNSLDGMLKPKGNDWPLFKTENTFEP